MEEILLTTSEAAKRLSVSEWTLRSWDSKGKLPALRTKGGHRRYKESDINTLMGIPNIADKRPESVAAYIRVSSHDQKAKGDLDRQKARVLEHCINKKYKVEHVLEDVGSGMSDTRPRLKKLFKLVTTHSITKVVVEPKDRLCRFGFGVYKTFFESHDVLIECIAEKASKSYEEELVEDLMSIMSSFSAKMYGKRSAGRRKQNHLTLVKTPGAEHT